MKKNLLVSLVLLFVLGLVTSAHALSLSAGQSALYSFDFSSDPVAPPYDGYGYEYSFEGMIDEGLGYGYSTSIGSDTSGDWITGAGDYEWTSSGSRTYYKGFTGDHDFDFTLDTSQFIRIDCIAGSMDIDEVGLNMFVRLGPGDGEIVSTEYIIGQPTASNVPEPATIVLLGSGIFGLAGFGRKKFKK